MKYKVLDRRLFLRGAGATAISLPFLDVMFPKRASAAPEIPVRTCFTLYPFGTYKESLDATGSGASYMLPAPYATHLDNLRGDLTYINDITSHWGKSNGDGPGDHARGQGTYLTQTHLDKDGISAGKSADRYIRDVLVGKTKVPNLNVAGPGASGGDSGYSAEYRKISWLNRTTPSTPIYQPHQAFDELFKGLTPSNPSQPDLRTVQNRLKKSILDEAIDDASRLKRQVGAKDKEKLDQYLTSIREVEQNIATLIENEGTDEGTVCAPGKRPSERLDFSARTEIMFKLIRLGFQCDITRLATFFMGTASFSFLGIPGNHHTISHHGNDTKVYPGQLIKINSYYASHWAKFVQDLKDTPDVGGSNLLDNCILSFGSDMADGNRHSNDGMTMAIAGRANNKFRPGRLLTGTRRLANIWLTIMQTMGVSVSSFGEGNAASNGTVNL